MYYYISVLLWCCITVCLCIVHVSTWIFLYSFFPLLFFNFYISIISYLFTRTGVAGAALQTASSLIHSLIQSVSDPFPPNLQDTFNTKPYELGTWHFERMFTSLQVSHITCHVSHVRCHMSIDFNFIFYKWWSCL